MKIYIYEWAGRLLEKTSYRDSRETGPQDGSLQDVWRIAGELYATGLNVMIKHHGDDHMILVDIQRFQQR